MDAGRRLKRIKGAQRNLIDRCGGIESAAEVCSYSSSTVGRWNDLNASHMMPLDVVLILEAFAGFAPVTQAMAEINNRRIVSPEGEVTESLQILGLLGELGDAFADLQKLGIGAIADGKFDINEARSLSEPAQRLSDVVAALQSLSANVSANGAVDVVPK